MGIHPHLLWFFGAILTSMTVGGCEVEDLDGEVRIHEVEGRCAQGVERVRVSIEPHVSAIGPLANALGSGDGDLWIVESGANTVSRYGPEVGFGAGFIDVGNDRNPYNLFVDGERGQIFVANYLAHTVSVADLGTGAVVAEIAHQSLKNPSDVVATARHVFVANVHYLSLAEGYGPGSISIFEREGWNFLGEVETAFKNPQFLELAEGPEGLRLLISAAGALRFGIEGVEVSSEGGLEIWDIADGPLESERQAYGLGQAHTPRIGGPGRPALTVDGTFVYLTSAIAPVLFKFDLKELRWIYDATTPFALYETSQDATHNLVVDKHGLLYVSAFNEDSLFIVDTACDEVLAGPLDLGRWDQLLEGPQSLELLASEEGSELYFIMSIANTLGRVKISF